MTCVDEDVFVEERVDRVLTQYRESPKLLHMIRTYVRHVAQVASAVCDMPEYFDLDDATGDQLTIIGKWMGFPRCHCICDVQPVFGFPCEGATIADRPIIGFCESGSWLACTTDGVSEICIEDDELYRALLIARSYQMQAKYGWDDLITAVKAIFGDQAKIMDAGHGHVVIAPFRSLTPLEEAALQVIPRALPIAPGVSTRWHFGTFEIFGFGGGWGGFCEPWKPEGLPISTEDGEILVTEDGDQIITGPLTRDADWLCRIDLKPYSC
ncbi:hypothetical protein IWQ49_006360 [Labrenzia sp. EL_126]|nr:hypothetical protein [Labrenzia sp. EL_126]